MTSLCLAEQAGMADKHWRSPVATYASLPAIGNQVGDMHLVRDTDSLYQWTGAAWALIASGGDKYVRVTVADTTSGYLNTKLLAGDGLSKATLVPGGDERLNLYVNVDDSTIEINTDTLRVKDSGITALKLNADTAGDGLSLAGGTNALTVNVDGTTLETNTDTLRIKALGVDTAQLADDSVTEPKLAMNNSALTNYYIRWNGTAMEWANPATTVPFSTVYKLVAQTLHGFAIGDVLRWDAGTSLFVKAKADTETNAEVVGIVAIIVDPDNFWLAVEGNVSGLVGLTPGAVHFLSGATAGALTATAPVTVGYINKPLLIAGTTTVGYFHNWRGMGIGVDVAPASPEFVVSSVSGSLPNEKVLTAGTDISVTPGVGITTIADTSTLQSVTGRGATTPTTVYFQCVNAIELGKDETPATPNIAGEMKLWSAGNNAYYTELTAGTQSATATYTLPTAMPVGSSGFLQSTTGGVMSWVAGGSVGVAGSDTQVQFNNSGAFGADAGFTFTTGTQQLLLGKNTLSGSLKLYSENGGTDRFVSLTPSASQTADTAYTLPVADGTTGQALTTNGSAVLAWATVVTPPGGADTYVQYNSGGTAFGGENTFTYIPGTDTLTAVNINPNGGDNSGKLGDTAIRWADIYCVNIHTGDIKMMNDWVIKEDWDGPNGIILISPDGKKFKFAVEEIK
jgi:hypothetical protein